jgi:transcriptional regulator with GAF, ATPase, and Fis domain
MYTIIGDSPWANTIRQSIRRAAMGSSTVLIVGPTGTGKELIARAIHHASGRARGPLVPVDCTSIPPGLFASQLFGHVKGAFSGADWDTLGSFRAADRGTVFLDEIGELGAELQSQLLRVIQERAVIPVGCHRSIPVDVRIIAATNRDLASEVALGSFRLDLYYRLNVIKLKTTPLAQRPDDIGPLCRSFLDRWSIENGLPLRPLSANAVRLLTQCEWPGNVRQLQNVLERAVVLTDGNEITADHLAGILDMEPWPAIPVRGADPAMSRHAECFQDDVRPGQPEGIAGRQAERTPCECRPACCTSRHGRWPTLAECEACLIRAALEQAFYNQSAAARLLHIDWRLLARKMRKYGIQVPRCRS